MSLARRVSRWAGADGRCAGDFAGDVTCSAAGGVFSMAKCLSGRGSRRLQALGHDKRDARQSRSTRLFRGLVAPGRPDDRNSHAGWLFTGVRAIAGEGLQNGHSTFNMRWKSDPANLDERDSSAGTIDNLGDLGHDISKCRPHDC
jgi:hypothetical protein